MSRSDSSADRVRFSNVEFDLRTGELWRDGRRTVLPHQLFRLLGILVEAGGSLVTRDELRGALWSDATFGDFENGLNAAIKRLREALGDSASEPRFIETIPRRGYRFIATVEEVAVVRSAGAPWHARASAIATVALTATIAVTTLLWFLFLRFADSSTTTRAELVRLTSTSGLNIDPAISPDESLVVYASDREGTTGLDLWVQAIGADTATRITSDDGDEAEPSFSPDGASLVYAKREAGGIAIVSRTGGHSRTLVQVPRARTPRFSPDGRWVLYWTGLPVWSSRAGIPHATGALEIVPASGGRPRSIATNFASARYGIWSPDGQQILFLGERDRAEPAGGLDWYLAPFDGGAPIRTGALAVLRSAGVSGVPVPGDWSAQDDTVIFASVGQGESNVWQVRLSRATGTIAAAPQRLTLGTAIERSPVGTSARRVAFTSLVENVDAWRVPLDPVSGLATGPLERVTDNAASDRVMNVSDDGRSLVFISSRDGRDTAWIRDLASGTERQLAPDQAWSARISRNGSAVAISSGEPSRPSASVIVSVEGGSRSTFCDGCQVFDWSSQGHALIGRGTAAQLFVRDALSGQETHLADHPLWPLFQGRFSPDGRWVAFQTTNTPTLRQVFVVPARAESLAFEHWIPVVTDFGIQPSWSPDGRGIYHFSFRDGAFCAWLQPLDRDSMRPAGPPRAVQHLHEPRLRAGAGAVATNDVRAGYIYMTLTETTGNVWTMTNASGRR